MGILGFIAFQFMIRNTVVRVDTQVTLKEDAPKFNPLEGYQPLPAQPRGGGAPRWPLSACSSVCTALKLLFKSCSNPILKTLVFPVSSACFLMSACSCSSPLLAKSSAKSARREAITIRCLCQRFGLYPDVYSAHHSGRQGFGAVCCLPASECHWRRHWPVRELVS